MHAVSNTLRGVLTQWKQRVPWVCVRSHLLALPTASQPRPPALRELSREHVFGKENLFQLGLISAKLRLLCNPIKDRWNYRRRGRDCLTPLVG